MSNNTVQGGSGINSKPPVPLAKPPHEIELERKKALLKKVKTLRESAVINRGGLIVSDPTKQYCWVNIRDDRRVVYESMEWTPCNSLKGSKVQTRWQQPDGTHKRADLVLYEIDIELYEAQSMYNQLRGIEGIEGSEKMFMAAMDRENVPVFKPGVK